MAITFTGGRIGLDSFYCYDNYSQQSSSTCGQAVVASILDHKGLTPYSLERTVHSTIDNRYHFDRDMLVGKVLGQFGPHWPIFKGMAPSYAIKKMLRAFNVPFTEHLGIPFTQPEHSLQILRNHLSKNLPVIVLIRVSPLHLGPRFVLHWAIIYAADDHNVYLATWEKSFTISYDAFVHAWSVPFLPYPYTYYQLLVH